MSASVGGEHDLLRAIYGVVDKLRWFLLAHALGVDFLRRDEVAHPWLVLLVCCAMVVWTPVVGRLQARPSTRVRRVVVADTVISLVLLASSGFVLGPAGDAAVIPITGFWVLAAPVAAAVWGGGRWGLGTGLCFALVRLLVAPSSDARTIGSLGVLVLVSWGLGTIVDTLRTSQAEREGDYARAAALAERDRMNRIVHDGALQVLALVEREGPELGPKGLYLANVARQQEAKLRALLQDRNVDISTVVPVASGTADITSLLEQHDSDTVTVSLMAGEVMMAAHRAHELDAAVSEVLANVAKHAGPSAKAWILLEEEDGQVIVSVRDNGHGMTREQVAAATSSGRLGIQNSILGRIADIGGVALARSQPGRGVEWEFRVPVEEAQ